MRAIEVFADIWCPFAHVGLDCVAARRSALGQGEVLLDIRAWPLELVNGAPLDPGTTAAHVKELRAQVAPHLFAGFNPRHFPSTSLPALACAHAAYRKDARTGEAVSFALRDALFEQGLNVARPDVLSDIAARFGVAPADGVDAQAVLDDWQDGIDRGVKGSPHFFCGEIEAFCPSLEIAHSGAGKLVVTNTREVLDTFLANCFSS